MRKEYVKPEIQVEEFLLESMMATSTPVGTENPGTDPEANSHRGSWGDLWN